MTEVGAWFVSVLPTFLKVQSEMQKGLVAPATEAGGKAGKGFSDAFAASTKSGAASAAAAVEASVKRAEAAILSSSQRVIAARAREEAAAGQVRVAEQRLAEARAKYGAESSQVIAAEERLATAQRNVTTTAGATQAATAKLNAAKAEAAGLSTKVADSAAKEAAAAAALNVKKQEAAALSSNTVGNAEKESVALTRTKTILSDTSPVIGKLISQYGKLGAAVGVAVVLGVGIHAVKAAGDFQASQERLVTTAGELQSNLKSVGDGVLTMAGQVGYSAQELSKGLYTVESAGYHGAEALKVMQAAAEGAKTENADLTVVTDAVTSAMQDYHLGADQAATVTSKMVTAVGDGKTTFEQLTGAMSAILPKAAAAHVNLDEILGDLSAMTLHGTSAQQASQNLADALSHLANPTLAQTKELAALGISAADLSKNLGQTGVSGAMLQIEQAVLQHMGPAGTTLLNAFNQSRQAAADAKTMFDNLPPAAKKVAQSINDGTLSFKDFRKAGGGLAVDQKALIDQWFSVQKGATGFSDALKTGGNTTQTFSQAMAKATGDSASLNVALQLTGENAATVQKNIKDISGATAEAGGHVKGWSEVQGTFNQKLDEIKSSMGAWLIQMGTLLLPALTSFLGWLQKIPAVLADVSHWVQDNKNWLGLLAAVVAGLAGPWLVLKAAMLGYQIAMTAVSVATKVWTAAQAALDAVMDANPIFLIITAIAGLVAGIIYAWTHFASFRIVVEAVFNALKTAAVAVWNGLVAAFHAIGDAAVWLWQTILKPIFDVISIAVRILVAIIVTVLVTPWVILFRTVLAPVFTWLWQTVIKPVFDSIGAIFSWLWNNVIKLIVGFIKLEIQAWAAVLSWLWSNVVKPVFGFIGDMFTWIWNTIIKPIVGFIKLEIQAWAAVLTWLWHTIVEPVFNGIGSAIKWVWDNVISPAFEGIKAGVQKVGDAFSAAKDFIGKVWDGVKDVISKPIHWVVDVVYTQGIKAVWDKVADFVHLGHLPDAPAFAGGGIMPGYAPGHDTQLAWLSPGEGILVPEAVRMLGPDTIHAINAAASGRPAGGGTHFAGGGIFGSIGNWISNTVSDIGSFLKDPIGNVGKALHGVIDGLASGVSDSPIAKMVFQIPGQAIDGLINTIKSWFSSSGSGGNSVPAQSGSAAAAQAFAASQLGSYGWGQDQMSALIALWNQESGWNANAVNPSSGAYGIPQSLGHGHPYNLGDYANQVLWGLNYIKGRYGSPAAAWAHEVSHNWYDDGGWLMPGVTQTVNATGKPEAVLTESQWGTVRMALAKHSGGGDRHYNVTSHDPSSVVAEIQRLEHLEMVSK